MTWQRVEQLLREDWGPEQISVWLKRQSLQSVSPEWIYQYILDDNAAGVNLHRHLRYQGLHRPERLAVLSAMMGIEALERQQPSTGGQTPKPTEALIRKRLSISSGQLNGIKQPRR